MRAERLARIAPGLTCKNRRLCRSRCAGSGRPFAHKRTILEELNRFKALRVSTISFD